MTHTDKTSKIQLNEKLQLPNEETNYAFIHWCSPVIR